ncbi:MAG: Holliday junction branch migration protein RuvA [Proteobacteria bacterium]|nr:Holliday junction branch migration protein RuvA [Pseudomonadota bacterium]
MIGRLTGLIVECEPQQVLLDVQGVGYEVEIPLPTYYQLSCAEGVVTLYTHLVVREDANLLFGFYTSPEREMFRALIKVNGVGPKMGLAILSGLDAQALVTSVRNNDVKALTALPGVGKKTAERLIIEMRDKVEAFGIPETAESGVLSRSRDVAGDAESALIGLGYRPQEASAAIARIAEPAEDVETLIRQALKELMQG